MTSNKSSGVPLLYSADPYKFASAFTSCMTDPACRIMYNHIQKTGGSYLASRLYPVLDENGRKYVSKKWCCDTGLWNRFANQTNHFCGLKFGIYETGVPMFANIIETCQQHTKKRKREIALITIRDPIKRTLSRINMRCNRSYKTLSEGRKKICQRCNYNYSTADRKFYDHYVNQTNYFYTGLAATSPRLLTMLNKEDAISSNVLILDNTDIDPFFANIEQQLQKNTLYQKGAEI